MFALEWVRILPVGLQAVCKSVDDYRSADIDRRTSSRAIKGIDPGAAPDRAHGFQDHPQIFVGGEFIGGCTDLSDAFRQGQVQQLMREKASV